MQFARALLPEPEHGVPDARDVPNRPPEGSEVRASGAAGRALVGLSWPGLGGRRLASRRRMAARDSDSNIPTELRRYATCLALSAAVTSIRVSESSKACPSAAVIPHRVIMTHAGVGAEHIRAARRAARAGGPGVRGGCRR